MELLKQFLTSKQAKTFYWQTINGLVILGIAFITELEWQYAAVSIALLNGITKWINREYLS